MFINGFIMGKNVIEFYRQAIQELLSQMAERINTSIVNEIDKTASDYLQNYFKDIENANPCDDLVEIIFRPKVNSAILLMADWLLDIRSLITEDGTIKFVVKCINDGDVVVDYTKAAIIAGEEYINYLVVYHGYVKHRDDTMFGCTKYESTNYDVDIFVNGIHGGDLVDYQNDIIDELIYWHSTYAEYEEIGYVYDAAMVLSEYQIFEACIKERQNENQNKVEEIVEAVEEIIEATREVVEEIVKAIKIECNVPEIDALLNDMAIDCDKLQEAKPIVVEHQEVKPIVVEHREVKPIVVGSQEADNPQAKYLVFDCEASNDELRLAINVKKPVPSILLICDQIKKIIVSGGRHLSGTSSYKTTFKIGVNIGLFYKLICEFEELLIFNKLNLNNKKDMYDITFFMLSGQRLLFIESARTSKDDSVYAEK